MGHFNRGDRGSFGRRDRDFKRGGGNFGRPSMHKAICDDCGQECEVPFKPSNDKPIYCNNCFGKHGGGQARNDRGQRPRFEDRKPAQTSADSKEIIKGIKTLNYKLDKLLEALVPEKQTEAKEEAKKVEVKETKPSTKKTEAKKTAKKKVAVKKTTTKKVATKKKK